MKKTNLIKILVVITYLVMVVVNFLANYLPINNRTTGDISNDYMNLFAPAGITFAIWGIIYFLLGLYVLYNLGFFRKKENKKFLEKINIYFIVSSIANALWIFSWHYDIIGLSLLFMITILISLTSIIKILNSQKLSGKDYFFVRLPFSIYLGWITVATIANVIVFLISIGVDVFGTSELLTIIMISVGAIIGILKMFKDKDIAYGLVFVWAFLGILIKHISPGGFGGKYSGIVITAIFCIALFSFSITFILFKKKNKN